MVQGVSNGYVTIDVPWPWKVKPVTHYTIPQRPISWKQLEMLF